MLSEHGHLAIGEQLLSCTDAHSLETEMSRFTEAMSFDYFSVVGVVERPKGTSFHNLALKIPDAYLETYMNIETGKSDPVMQHLKTANSPVWWDKAYYDSHDQRKRWEVMAECGMRSGAVLALHMPAGKHLIVGMDQRRETSSGAEEQQRTLAALTLFATYVAEPALVVLDATDAPPLAKLTKQEIECLKWRGEGKSAWMTGQILNLSESRVHKICASAARKLGCSTALQAALRAQRSGLLP